MSDKVVVRFLKAWRGYSADELAGFDPDVVEGLKAKGFAEVYEGAGGATSRQRASKPAASKPRATKPSGKSDESGEGGSDDVDAGGAENGEGTDGADGGGAADESTENTDDEVKP
ncbi:hypothetical protein GHO45_10710 [Pseudomonas sp. FSL R10-0765]|uniref:hypothetical protein n=1 Tax=Pseudomonas sp. FSL R10-0765 TaxID=2662195 RepID=UPI001297A951|nr:hypothetical protein [Pseudomonas sp. FSL R10-0765]MQT41393.1 hypothetical protein [Pseudomonas sp. FSL R10-0765]